MGAGALGCSTSTLRGEGVGAVPGLRVSPPVFGETPRCGPSSRLAPPPPSLPAFSEAQLDLTEGLVPSLGVDIRGPRDSPHQPELKTRDLSSRLRPVTDLLCRL